MKRSEIVSVGHIELKSTEFKADVNFDELPVLPTRNLVLFPDIVFPITLVRESSRRVAEYAEQNNIALAVVCQRDETVGNPRISDLHKYGVLAQILKVIPIPDGSALAMVMSASDKIHIDGQSESGTASIPLCVKATSVKDAQPRVTEAFRAKVETAHTILKELTDNEIPGGLPELTSAMDKANYTKVINSMCAAAPVSTEARSKMLAASSIRSRLEILTQAMVEQVESNKIRAEIEEGARRRMGERQRTAILETQLEQIRAELYGDGSEAKELADKLVGLDMSDENRETIAKEIDKLEHLNQQSPDYQVQLTFLQTVLNLPWGIYTTDENNFSAAEKELDNTHFGLEKVKERVLEQLAVKIHSPKSQSPIICLVGPPGVGKTSLGQSIAKAMGRKFQRVSLGGLHDESEIRGHRRTYIGAMPGRIISAIKRAGTMNPVIMLDEIDKIGSDYKGDPSAALLEVLDPEQNVKFHDNYIDLDFDLSKAMFITTANTLQTISSPLLDRMEIISLSGYSLEEKIGIATNHLLPQLSDSLGLEKGEVTITDAAIATIIENYTSESGVRQLQKHLATIMRKYIRAKVSGNRFDLPVEPKHLRVLLGIETMSRDKFGTDDMPGVVTGLAWTAAGGEILFIESILTSGKGDGQLTLTGNLGDVMKESAAISHRYVRAHADRFGIEESRLKSDIHIHVPEGAIPKDGPSAGITMTTAIVSAMTGRPVRRGVAMTGEMTLRGKVLPVGGIKEKILAAKRAGITEIILSKENQRHIEDIKSQYVDGLTFHYVTTVDEVIKLALS